ncbi:MAG: hypothetical protein MJY45_06170, partial [Bacteroidales bacterium]|nr:hypothetical protein [Bacteroidales bacterium]
FAHSDTALRRLIRVNPFCLTPAADAAAPVGHAACTSFQRVSPWLNVHFAHSDTALRRLISQPLFLYLILNIATLRASNVAIYL